MTICTGRSMALSTHFTFSNEMSLLDPKQDVSRKGGGEFFMGGHSFQRLNNRSFNVQSIVDHFNDFVVLVDLLHGTNLGFENRRW